MKTGTLAGVLLAVLAHVAAAQPAPPATSQPTFRSTVTLVTVDVTVADREWKPVAGLTADDFEVELEGKRRPVRTVDYQRDAIPDARPGVSTLTTTASMAGRAGARTFILLIDDLSYSPLEGRALQAAAERFINGLPAADHAGLVTSSGRYVVQPTSDRSSVTAFLRRIVGIYEPPQKLARSESVLDRGAMVIIDPERIGTAEALRVARGDQGVVGSILRRFGLSQSSDAVNAIFSISRDIAFATATTVARQARAWAQVASSLRRLQELHPILIVASRGIAAEADPSALSDFERSVREAGLRVHILSEIGGLVQAEDAQSAVEFARADDDLFKSGLEEAAARVGGSFQRAAGTADQHFNRIVTASSGWYRLAIEIPSDTPAGRSMRAKVKVSRAGVTLHVVRDAISPGPPVVLSPEQQVESALAQGRLFYGVPVTVTTAIHRDPAGSQLQLLIRGSASASSDGPASVAFALIGSTGRVARGGTTIARAHAGQPTEFDLAVPVMPGDYRLRVAVADGAGAVGSIEQPVAARLRRLGSYLSSDVLVSWTDADGRASPLTSETVPDSAAAVDISMELYQDRPETSTPATTARIQVTDAGGAVLWTSEAAVEMSRDAAAVAIRLPIQHLEPGGYTALLMFLADGVAIGDRRVLLHKATPAVAAVPSPEVIALPSTETVLGVLRQEAALERRAFDATPFVQRSAVDRYFRAIAAATPPRTPSEPVASDDDYWRLMQQITKSGGRTTAPFARAILALKNGDSAAAHVALETALVELPSSAAVMLYLGVAHAVAGRDQDAIGAWSVALADPAATVEWHLAQAEALARIGELPDAIRVLTEAAARWPETPGLDGRLGRFLLAQGEFAAARQALERGLARAPDDASLFLLTALAFADAVRGDASTADRDGFRALAERYLQTGGPRVDVVRSWHTAIPAGR